MSIAAREANRERDVAGPSDFDRAEVARADSVVPFATASDLAFARQDAKQVFWRRTKALIKRGYAPLLVYAILAAALIAIIAIRVAAWVPHIWY